MSYSGQESQILDSIVPKLEAEGYSVYLRPSRQMLPPFMGDFLPDAIALGSPKNLAIEVVVEGQAPPKVEHLQQRFEASDDWELRLYYLRPNTTDNSLEVAASAAIDDSLRAVEKLASSGQLSAALLIGWATFEAIGRALLPDRFKKPQTPGRLIEVLAAEGHVTPSEADTLRRLANNRNKLIHGMLSLSIDPKDVSAFIGIMRTLLQPPAEAA